MFRRVESPFDSADTHFGGAGTGWAEMLGELGDSKLLELPDQCLQLLGHADPLDQLPVAGLDRHTLGCLRQIQRPVVREPFQPVDGLQVAHDVGSRS